jgi:flavin-dependent dehydrogenase
LRGLAAEAGVALFEHASDLAVELRDGRIVALDGRLARVGSPARAVRVEAALFVDASGRRGVLRRESPALARWCPTVQRDELCSAADFHLRIDDPDGAKRFLERHDAVPGDNVTVVGTNGGFSTRGIAVGPGLDRVGVLVGCLANGRYGTGPGMLDAVRAREPWIGGPISGGFGVIPLRRPYARCTAPGLALVGDAACQVFPAHGSGIGVGLVAGRILAESIGAAADPGDEAALWRYQAAFQHELGGTLAAYDGIRRMSTALGAGGVAAMVDGGLMTEPMTRAGLDQVWAGPSASELPGMAARMARRPGLAAAMLPRLARSRLLGSVGRRHPGTVDEGALARWDRRVERLLGPLPS